MRRSRMYTSRRSPPSLLSTLTAVLRCLVEALEDACYTHAGVRWILLRYGGVTAELPSSKHSSGYVIETFVSRTSVPWEHPSSPRVSACVHSDERTTRVLRARARSSRTTLHYPNGRLPPRVNMFRDAYDGSWFPSSLVAPSSLRYEMVAMIRLLSRSWVTLMSIRMSFTGMRAETPSSPCFVSDVMLNHAVLLIVSMVPPSRPRCSTCASPSIWDRKRLVASTRDRACSRSSDPSGFAACSSVLMSGPPWGVTTPFEGGCVRLECTSSREAHGITSTYLSSPSSRTPPYEDRMWWSLPGWLVPRMTRFIPHPCIHPRGGV